MWCNQVIIVSTIIPFLNCQLYFPDESGGFMHMQDAVKSSSAAGSVQLVQNLTELRGTAEYDQRVDKIIASGILKLTLDVQKALIGASSSDYSTIVYSPINVAGALALVLLGSNGKTFEEVSTIMGLATGVDIQSRSQLVHEQFGRMLDKLQDTSGFNLGRQITFAAAIFVQNGYPIRQVYKETAETVYDSEVLNVDFQSNPGTAQQIINAWVSERTKGKITDILGEPPSGDTKVILASATYFKAEWERPFFDGTTRRRPFYPNGRNSESKIMVDMMSNGGIFPYFKDRTLDCQIIGFPYKGNHSTMYVVVPNNSNKDKLKQLENSLTPAEIERLLSNLKYTGAIVLFPKMRIDTTLDLKQTLSAMGMRSLFNPSQSNLALLSPGQNSSDEDDSIIGYSVENPILAKATENEVLIFNRYGEILNCTQVVDPKNNVSTCEKIYNETITQQNVTEKKNITRRRLEKKITPRIAETLDSVRQYLNRQNNAEKFENPGLYADTVIHKVYMDITESGTEAAAATSISLSRDGGRVTMRIDIPFFFFIMHEDTKTILFWGSVNTPTPNYT